MAVFVYIILGLLLIVLQTTVFMIHPLWVAAPDFYYILLAYLAYRFDTMRSLIVVLVMSWVLDIFSGVVIGMYPAICFGSFFLLKIISTKVPLRESIYQIPMVGVCYLVVLKIVYLGILIFEPEVLGPWSWPEMIVRAFLIVLMAYPMFRGFESLNARLQKSIIPHTLLRVKAGNRYRRVDKR